MCNLFDQSKNAQSLELARHGRWCDVDPLEQICAPPAVDVELASLQGSQKGLFGGIEKVQAHDAWVGTHAELAQPLQATLAGTGIIEAGEKSQITLVAAQQNN